MGFPRISDMIALSPPRYSKDRLRKLYITKAVPKEQGLYFSFYVKRCMISTAEHVHVFYFEGQILSEENQLPP